MSARSAAARRMREAHGAAFGARRDGRPDRRASDAPIGLDIGAGKPAEIAVAVLAQIDPRVSLAVGSASQPKGEAAWKFGPIAVENAQAWCLPMPRWPARRFRKAHRADSDDIPVLKAACIGEVVAAMLSPDDLGEDLVGDPARRKHGRFRGIEAKPADRPRQSARNCFGVLTVDNAMIDRVKRHRSGDYRGDCRAVRGRRERPNGRDGKNHPLRRGAAGRRRCPPVNPCGSGGLCRQPVPADASLGVIQTVLPSVKDSVLAIDDPRHRNAAGAVGQHGRQELQTPHASAPVAVAIASLAAESHMVIVFVRRHFATSRTLFHPPSSRQAARFFAPACRSIPEPAGARKTRRHTGDRRARLRPEPQGKRF